MLSTPQRRNASDTDFGVDAKYGVTQNLTADFTYNTDFAQVEADEQQVNLTRFSLFFPEKREFFLENQGTFAFSGVAASAASDTPILFYSRRIGLNGGVPVPIIAGGRLTGRAGRYNIGVLNIRTADTAGHGRIHVYDLLLGQLLADGDRRRRTRRRQVDVAFHARAMRGAVRTKRHRLQNGRRGQAEEHRLAEIGHLLGR